MKPAEIVGIVIILALAGFAVWYELNADKAEKDASPLSQPIPGQPVIRDQSTELELSPMELADWQRSRLPLIEWLRRHPGAGHLRGSTS